MNLPGRVNRKRLMPQTGEILARRALSLVEAGDWQGAHDLVQDDPSPEAAWVHAHLHRVEGDLFNAGYWYRRAGKPQPSQSLEDERKAIANALGGAVS
jgi:hypothetical protein